MLPANTVSLHLLLSPLGEKVGVEKPGVGPWNEGFLGSDTGQGVLIFKPGFGFRCEDPLSRNGNQGTKSAGAGGVGWEVKAGTRGISRKLNEIVIVCGC